MNKKSRDRKVEKIVQLKKNIDSYEFNIIFLKETIKDEGFSLGRLDKWVSFDVEVLFKDFNDFEESSICIQFLNKLIQILEAKKRSCEEELTEILKI